MAWIESHQALREHPKTLRLMTLMAWDLDQTIGKLHRFWWWCLDYAEDGDLRPYNDVTLGSAVTLNGEHAKGFVVAMVSCGGSRKEGFLERKPYFRVHDWWDRVGPWLRAKYKKSPHKWERVRNLYLTGVVTVTEPYTNQPNQPNQPKDLKKDGAASPPSPVQNLVKKEPDDMSTVMAHVQQALKTKTGAVRDSTSRTIYGKVVAWVKNHPGKLDEFLTMFDKTPDGMAPAWYISRVTAFVNDEQVSELKAMIQSVGREATRLRQRRASEEA